jgi:hypothetical protein
MLTFSSSESTFSHPKPNFSPSPWFDFPASHPTQLDIDLPFLYSALLASTSSFFSSCHPAPRFKSSRPRSRSRSRRWFRYAVWRQMYLPRQELSFGKHLNTDGSQFKHVRERGLVREASCIMYQPSLFTCTCLPTVIHHHDGRTLDHQSGNPMCSGSSGSRMRGGQ